MRKRGTSMLKNHNSNWKLPSIPRKNENKLNLFDDKKSVYCASTKEFFLHEASVYIWPLCKYLQSNWVQLLLWIINLLGEPHDYDTSVVSNFNGLKQRKKTLDFYQATILHDMTNLVIILDIFMSDETNDENKHHKYIVYILCSLELCVYILNIMSEIGANTNRPTGMENSGLT